MTSDIWLRTILIVRKETRCRHIGYAYRLTARVLLYAPSHRQDNTYHGLCYTSRGALAGTRNSSMGPPHEEAIRRPTAPWANALPLSYVPCVLKLMWSILAAGGRTPLCLLRPWKPASWCWSLFAATRTLWYYVLLSTFSKKHNWRLWVCNIAKDRRKEGNVLFNDALNTFYLRLYASDIW